MYWFGNIAAPLLVCFTTLIATLYWADPRVVLEPTALLPLLNTVFLAVTPFCIVFISTKLFLAVGRLPLLMLGCGMLALGGGGAVSGWFIAESNGPNTTVTIYNCGALLSGLLLLASVVVRLLEPKDYPPRGRFPLVLTSYLGVVLLSCGVVVAAVTERFPPFIVQGSGPTMTGRAILAAAIACYAATAALSVRQYLKSRVEQLRWYATGLALFATGLVGVLLQKSVGSPIGWAGRTAQYTGGVCILIGVLTFWKTIISTGRPIAEAFGEVSRRRISELEQMNAQLKEMMQEQSIILQNVPIAIFKIVDRKQVWINRKAEELFQYSKTEMEYQTTRKLYPSEEAYELLGREAYPVLTQGLPFETEQELIRRDGGRLRVRYIGKAIDPPDLSKGTLWLLEDVTERRTLESKLAESEAKFRSLVMNAPFLVTNVDRAGTIEFINRCSDGFDADAVTGTSSYDYLEGDSKEIYRAALERTFAEQTPQRIMVAGLGDNGATRWFETVLGPLVTDGRIESAIQVTIDITERKLAEMALENARDELERQVAARTESLTAANLRLRAEVEERMRAEDQILEHQKKMEALTQELSLTEERERERIAGELHDQVGQHLILVKLKLQWLANELASEKEIAVAEEIDKLLSQSIQDIRSLTFQLRPPILANAGLGAAIKWLAEELRETHGLDFELVDNHTPLSLRYEVRSSIFQAVREILLNVVKHSRCSLARIRLSGDGGRMLIEISDNGTGFDPVEAARKKSRTGGFGLFNVRKKIEYLGGEFRIETEPGAGTRVVVLVPADLAGSAEPHQ
ncbi:PAS domain-containing sensor histidine kinase [Geomonas azotofigens]|uniref:PAS domain-containing sensor histidine kinase n=1 Tax=Geomonas azotofigens TaxID=2843196 RepID=UPI001C0F4632|nr:PAS domain S-box protein [Geomonas azotofigens]MBU5612688.1 PAS domain S-box protein [Geomonas azotofigens]